MAEGGGSNLPPGFHFFPSEEELVCYFLHRKASMIPCHSEIIPTLALHRFDPWDLHCKALRGGNYWYFFTCRTQRRETPSGYWRQDGVEQPVKDVGKKSTLIFHAGDPPNGIRTNWVMHEYCFAGNVASSSSSSAQKTAKKKGRSKATDAGEWVVCRVYEASSGAQLGSKEEGMELSCLDEIYLSFDDYDENNGVWLDCGLSVLILCLLCLRTEIFLVESIPDACSGGIVSPQRSCPTLALSLLILHKIEYSGLLGIKIPCARPTVPFADIIKVFGPAPSEATK
ncbi:hypothetical protein HPP92_009057 [Vanilla planifolia]|uniref:NAC domain-containing protein n=1 Tax=Vanilla planifolia TaxID=51239 RepID=A0A835RJ03_VANPL|nr:hypothetical protein HPP92_009057 [Vanilla planifolia]